MDLKHDIMISAATLCPSKTISSGSELQMSGVQMGGDALIPMQLKGLDECNIEC